MHFDIWHFDIHATLSTATEVGGYFYFIKYSTLKKKEKLAKHGLYFCHSTFSGKDDQPDWDTDPWVDRSGQFY